MLVWTGCHVSHSWLYIISVFFGCKYIPVYYITKIILYLYCACMQELMIVSINDTCTLCQSVLWLFIIIINTQQWSDTAVCILKMGDKLNSSWPDFNWQDCAVKVLRCHKWLTFAFKQMKKKTNFFHTSLSARHPWLHG